MSLCEHESLPVTATTAEIVMASLPGPLRAGQRATIKPHEVWNPNWGFLHDQGGPCTVLEPGVFFSKVVDSRGATQRLFTGHLIGE